MNRIPFRVPPFACCLFLKRVVCAAVLGVVLAAGLQARPDYGESVLVDLVGVGLEIRRPNIQSEEFELSVDEIEAQVLSALKELKIRVLSDIELDVMPGQPYLELSIDLAHAQGPSHIYCVELKLREMAKLERPKQSVVTIAVGTWERKSIGIANRAEGVLSIVDKLVRIFADEMREMNLN